MKKVYLGINVSHGASAALIIDGTIVRAFQEERFTKIKNFVGYPKISIDRCLSYIKKRNLKINEATFSTIRSPIFPYKYPFEHFFSIQDWLNYYGESFYSKKIKGKSVKSYILKLKKNKKNNANLYLDYKKIKTKDYFKNYSIFREMQRKYLAKQSNGLIDKISFMDHHTCHAYYAAFSPDIKEKKCAIITLDGEGDGLNQTFWIFQKKKLQLKKITKSSECELARAYKFITLILKMKPNEHEYKVMGLAPYAKYEYSLKIYEEVFKNLLKVRNCKVVHHKRPKDLFKHLCEKTKKYRFDNIARAVQIFVEEITKKLFYQIYKRYKIKSFSLSGGLSMNIKMNKVLAEQSFLKKLYVSPTGTDESLAIGACYYLARKEKTKPIKNIYLGQNLFDRKIDLKIIQQKISENKKFKIHKNFTHSDLARLISNGEIIAVARGKEEFGARALGNRSILANPQKEGVIQEINEMIKNRDFWMPFALSIIHEKYKDYIINSKSIDSDFMTIGFDTKKNNYLKIKNGTHPYDKTVRPQILKKNFNTHFYSIIKEFEKISGIPALLNTSLNLHGSPISSSLEDVIYTFKNSGLKYLYLNDEFLIKKTNI